MPFKNWSLGNNLNFKIGFYLYRILEFLAEQTMIVREYNITIKFYS